jgi:hypothetical protein
LVIGSLDAGSGCGRLASTATISRSVFQLRHLLRLHHDGVFEKIERGAHKGREADQPI